MKPQLQVHTALVVERDLPLTSILMLMERNTSCNSKLLAVKLDTAWTYILLLVLVVVKGINPARPYCWR
jgi:hypothetical protein